MSIITSIKDEDMNDDTKYYLTETCYDLIFDSGWKLDACLNWNDPCFEWNEFLKILEDVSSSEDYVLKRNRNITKFLNKWLKNGYLKKLNGKPILDDNTTIIAYASDFSNVFCRIDTPYNENFVSTTNLYRYLIDGKDMVSYFVTIKTNVTEDTHHSNQCVLRIYLIEVSKERALTLLPTFKAEFEKVLIK